MATITKERPETRERVVRGPEAAAVRKTELPERRLSRSTVGSATVGRLDVRQEEKRGFLDNVARGIGELFIELGFFGQARLWLRGSRLISSGEKTLLDAELMGCKQAVPFTIPGTSILGRGSRNFKHG